MAQTSRPNVVYIMADQMSAPLLRMYNKDSVIKTPNLDKLAEDAVVFDSAYCNSPLCAPSRFTMCTGQLPSRIGGYDNAANFGGDVPTYAHYLRMEGYHTALAGKMHFVGADQLHGFEERLTPDIYPGDYGWTVNWDDPEIRPDWYHNMSSVLESGPIARTNQLDFDEEVIYKSTQWLYDHARKRPNQPFALTMSLTHPHDPYEMTREFWDLYADVDIPLPTTPAIPHDQQDPHSTRILKCIELFGRTMPEHKIRDARRAYFAACSYVDSNVGKLVKVLRDCGLWDNTILVFSGDHGDMLGERGLWYKMSWFEHSARVPLLVRAPKGVYGLGEEGSGGGRRVGRNVSTMDLMPTFVEMVGGKLHSQLPLDGVSLMPYLTTTTTLEDSSSVGELLEDKTTDTVLGEYMGEGTICPVVMIRRGRWKWVYAPTDPPQLYDVQADPLERENLAKGYTSELPARESVTASAAVEATTTEEKKKPSVDPLVVLNGDSNPQQQQQQQQKPATPPRTPSQSSDSESSSPSSPTAKAKATAKAPSDSALASLIASFQAETARRWDFPAITAAVLQSQRRRRLVHAALSEGKPTMWEYATPDDPTAKYVRNHGKGALGDVEDVARFPYPGGVGVGR